MTISNYALNILAPDLIITNGKIITVDDEFSFAEAVAIKENKILAVGTNAEIEELRGEFTKTLDLQGNVAMPGINDSHAHFGLYALDKPPFKLDLTYPNVKTIEDMRLQVKQAAESLPKGAWILGRGWHQGFIKELVEDTSKQLSKADFDDVSPDNPIYLMEYSYHNAVVNSKTLEIAGITRNTPSPEGGTIVKDANGEPTGLLSEQAFNLIEKIIPPFSRETTKEALLQNAVRFSQFGVTSLTAPAETPAQVNLYTEVAARGDFPIRINILLMWSPDGISSQLDNYVEALKYVGTSSKFGNDRLKIGGAKIFADGIPPLQTAWIYDTYPDGSHGALVTPGKDDEEKTAHLQALIKLMHNNGYQVGIHATGDRAMDESVKALAAVLQENPWDARHYTLHGDWIPAHTMRMMAENGIAHNTQTALKYILADDTTRRLGEEKSGDQWPLRDLLDAGIRVCNSSDAPVVEPDWRVGLQTAITREAKGTGNVSGIHQAITVAEGIRSYTIEPAWLDHAEHIKGSIESGKLADFCIIGKDITAIDPHEIMDTPILMTIMDGKVVYSDNSLKIA